VEEARRRKMRKLKAAVLSVLLVLFSVGVAAAENDTTNINWTEIGDLISGVTEIFGPIGDLVVAVVPLIILFIVVGFITGLFDGIIGGIQNALRRL